MCFLVEGGMGIWVDLEKENEVLSSFIILVY